MASEKRRGILQIVIFALALTTTAVVLHEAGHLVTGWAAGCKDISITLFSTNLETYTSMQCAQMGGLLPDILALSGFLFVVPFAIALYLQGGYEKFYSLVVLGFNFMIASADMELIGQIAANATIMAGAILILVGENMVISRFMNKLDIEAIINKKNMEY